MNTTEASLDQSAFLKMDRPHIALITNHGYGGVDIPIGGAPDTGGQNVYVNAVAVALDNLGYKVTIYARGGFPFYESERIRAGHEFLTDNVRYVYVPGGGDEFIRKEDISIALIEELEWIYDQIEEEAAQLNIFPWQYYDMINTHYWDAGVLAVSMVVRWQNDICSRMAEILLKGAIRKSTFEKFHRDRHYHFISKAPALYIGKLLLMDASEESYVYQEEVMLEAFRKWTAISPLADKVEEQVDKHIDWLNLRSTIAAEKIQLRPLILAKVLGTAILDQEIKEPVYNDDFIRRFRSSEGIETYHDLLKTMLQNINKHVWTPHSLGVIKERNFKNKSKEVNRNLKFRERRSHERMICDYTPAFAATSYEVAESLITNYGVNLDGVLFFPPGVDTKLFKNYSDQELRGLYHYLNEETGLEVDTLKNSTILFETSRMDSTKRKDVLLRAFIKAIPNVENALLIIGGGPENEVYQSLQKILEDHPESKNKVFLLGFIPDEYLSQLFGLCDIYVSASEMEGFGMSVAQAAIIGKPIVSSNKIPFTSFYLADEAIIVPAGNINKFAEAIEQLVGSKEDRKKRGEATREKAMGLEWENLTKNFIVDLNKMNFDIPLTEQILQRLI